VYLVTGGLGKIGTTLCTFLVRTTTNVKLVLTGRSKLPPESEWDSWLEADPDSPLAQRIRSLRDLRARGADVLYVTADAADRAQMARVIDEAERRFGRIDGVVHAAGDTESYTPINEVERADVERQFRAKLHGAVVLDELLGGRDLDFCVFLSSLSSLVGGIGLVAYAAANCFLDALARSRNQEGRMPWISVNWCAWHFPPEDELADGEMLREENAILPSEGEAAFQAILARAPCQVVVSRMDVGSLYNEAVRGAAEPVEIEIDDGEAAAIHERPELSTPYVSPRSADEQVHAEIWQELLGVAPIGVFDDFFELGGHSLLAIQLISRLRRAFEVDVPVSRVFEFPTIADLAESIARARATLDEQEAKTAAVLELVESLSDSDVQALLADGSDTT
jgi:NAD(P)-dependent dehydrogenase (short-subunit alcohol dehydrogenase family)/acyl carrier protein